MLYYVKLCQVNSNANGLILEQVLKILSLIGLSMKKIINDNKRGELVNFIYCKCVVLYHFL